MLIARTRVNFEEPDVELRVDHEITSKQLKTVRERKEAGGRELRRGKNFSEDLTDFVKEPVAQNLWRAAARRREACFEHVLAELQKHGEAAGLVVGVRALDAVVGEERKFVHLVIKDDVLVRREGRDDDNVTMHVHAKVADRHGDDSQVELALSK